MAHQEKSPLPPHVLIFPFPLQGHVNSMLKLAELLSLAAVHVTFLLSDFSHRRLLRHTDTHSRFSRYPGFRFETISDGLPDDHPRAGLRVMDIMPSLQNVTGPLFKEMMVASDFLRSEDRRPVTCIIADGILSFAGDFALEKGIPLVYFRTISACAFWAYYRIQEVIEAGEVPLKGNGMDLLVKSVPGMEGFLRRRDLPGFCRVDEVSDPHFQVIKNETRQTPRAQAVILNTFETLEGPVLSHIRTRMPNLFTIGPLHAHLKFRLSKEKTTTTLPSTASSSFWEEDRSCIEWLDRKPPKSVIYVSFGSITVLSRDQLMEFWKDEFIQSAYQMAKMVTEAVMFPMSPDSVPSTMPPRSSNQDEIDTNEKEEVWSGYNGDEEEVSSGSSKKECDEICINEDGKEEPSSQIWHKAELEQALTNFLTTSQSNRPSLFNSEVWRGQSSITSSQVWGGGQSSVMERQGQGWRRGQISFTEMLNARDNGKK
ncbi:hypothetical protein RHGRI_027593 [Rhododendron griersonianum]|uniref:Uncharacterized protein n=1 Tax=Rhododendron griersonianum TaxID=479676 RepID=A0AAV6IZ30_9ERIC|nr:hypothetical protein RHGRI_027593 [Rhododendron griersonianum]